MPCCRCSADRFRFARIAILVPLLGLLLSGCGVNNIPAYDEHAKAKWSEVQNQYQRRADLIPNLVETVKGYAKQESSVLEAVTNARAKATAGQGECRHHHTDPEAFKKFQTAQAQLSGALGRLLAVSAESYPDLEIEPELSGPCSRSSKEPKTGSRWPAATISRRYGSTMPR